MHYFIDKPKCGKDLYDLYLKAMERTRTRIVRTTAAGTYRNDLLSMYRPLPREHFEARIEALASVPGKHQEISHLLHSATT